MKKIQMFYLFLINVVVLFCSTQKLEAQSKLFRQYFLTINDADSSFIKKDNIVFYKTQQKSSNSRIDFFEDSKFNLLNGVTTDQIEITNQKIKSLETKIDKNANTITGKYAMLIKQSSPKNSCIGFLKLILENGCVIKYNVEEKKTALVLTKTQSF